MRKILVLAGPSAVGKTTVMKEILEKYPEFEFVRSATTREVRNDSHKSEYIYLSKDEFCTLIEAGGVLEYTEYGGNFYGTPSSEIERILGNGKIPMLILDINGVETLKSVPRSFKVVAVYITADAELLDKRLYDRFVEAGKTDAAYKIYETRKDRNRKELESLPEFTDVFDAFVDNTTPAETANKILSVFKSF